MEIELVLGFSSLGEMGACHLIIHRVYSGKQLFCDVKECRHK